MPDEMKNGQSEKSPRQRASALSPLGKGRLPISTNLTDSEIKSILAEFAECGIVEHNIASVDFIKSVLDLINRLQAEKQKLEIELQAMRGAANSYKAENERLKETNKNMSAYVKGNNWGLVSFVEFCKNLKAEAVTEFAERLKEEIIAEYNEYDEQEYPRASIEDIENLLKELVGEDNNHTSKFVGAKKVMVPYLEVGIEGYDPAGKVPYLPPEAIVKHKEIIKKE